MLAAQAVLARVRAPLKLTSLAPFAVKGKRALVEGQLVGEPFAVGSRSDGGGVPLAGRERALRTLRDAVAAGRAGAGRVVELRGEPGIGKSRLVAEVAAKAARDGMSRLAIEAGAYGTSTPYFALRAPLRRLVEAESDEEVAAALTRVVRAHLPPQTEAMAQLIAIAFGLELPPTAETARLSRDASAAQLHVLVDRLLFLRELASAARGGAQLDELRDTVETLLTARIDTLAPAQRRLLRRAAVLGQRFPLSWLAGMLDQPEDELRAGLASLSHFRVAWRTRWRAPP